jgi:hypothetical protein
MSSISLVFWTDIRLHQNQVHRGAAESAEGVFSYDPIGPSPRRSGFVRAGGRQRLDHKLSPFGNRFRLHFMAMGLQEMYVPTCKRAFYLAASHRQIKKSLLCVLSDSAVTLLFWTRMISQA